jgi:hypothetical protein
MNRYALFLFIPIFLVFFVWGLQVGNNLDNKAPVDSTNQLLDIKKDINSLPNGQKSLFIFIVSQMDTQTPDLLGVWLMSYMSSEPYATVLALYPTPIQNDKTIDNRMVASFKLKNVNGIPQLNDEFLTALNKTNIWSNGYVIIDLEGLNEVLLISAKEANTSTNLNVEEIIYQISNLNESSDYRLISQTILLQRLCNKFTLVNSLTDLKTLRDLYPNHITSNIDPDLLLGDWQQFIKSHNGSFCVFPQKEMLFQIGN